MSAFLCENLNNGNGSRSGLLNGVASLFGGKICGPIRPIFPRQLSICAASHVSIISDDIITLNLLSMFYYYFLRSCFHFPLSHRPLPHQYLRGNQYSKRRICFTVFREDHHFAPMLEMERVIYSVEPSDIPSLYSFGAGCWRR